MREKLIEKRGKRSQRQIAELLGISQQAYSLVERGIRNPQPKDFARYEAIFDDKIQNLAPDIFMPRHTT